MARWYCTLLGELGQTEERVYMALQMKADGEDVDIRRRDLVQGIPACSYI